MLSELPAARDARWELEAADRAPRRCATPVLRPALDLCKPTGVDLAPGSRVIVVHEADGIGPALAARLVARGVTVLPVGWPVTPAVLEGELRMWLDEGPIQGIYWLPALDPEPPLAELSLATFRAANQERVKNLALAMRVLYDSVAARGTFLVAATRLGGMFGLGVEGATAPLGGAVAGFTKAYKRERPDALVKVVDVVLGASAVEVAETLVAETLSDPGLVEVGVKDGLRWTIGLEERPAADGNPGLALTRESVFVVTGAAGGITSAIVEDLAQASGGVFYLLDLVAVPARDDQHIARFREGREALKSLLIEEAKQRGEKPTPVAIDKRLLAVERQDAALRAIEAVERAGGTAHYRSVNLLDGPAVAAVVEEIGARHGRIDVLLHAGGIEISRPLAAKEPAEFDLVFDIKADGYFSLLKAAEGMPIGASVVFSSVAGRFGNAGQTDYAAANALLCSLSRSLRRTRPETRAIAIDWTAWGGIGMATRGSIPKIMELAGIEMLAPEVGVPTIRRELVRGGTADEIVVGGKLGILVSEWDADGGIDRARLEAERAAAAPRLGLAGSIVATSVHGGLVVETTLDPQRQPFLFDHQIDGVPVLPGVMGLEAFAETASLLCPGLVPVAFEQVSFAAPFKFHRQQPATLRIEARALPAADGGVRVEARLVSRLQPRPELPVQERVHFTGTVRMGQPGAAPAPLPGLPALAGEWPVSRGAIYQLYFHGPAYRVLDGVRLLEDGAVAQLRGALPANADPADGAHLAAPRLVESCFQAAGILELARTRRLGLPTAIDRVVLHRALDLGGTEGLHAVVRDAAAGGFDVAVVDPSGVPLVEVFGYRTIALPGERSLEEAQASAEVLR